MVEEKKIRLDKWLWAARFFKTRSLAKKAIEAGHVFCEGSRVKASKEVRIGALLKIRQGLDIKIIHIMALSDRRQSADIAQGLYEETLESINKRKEEAMQRKQLRQSQVAPETKPDKKNRRLIHRFKQKNSE